jgi:hypothetical protein
MVLVEGVECTNYFKGSHSIGDCDTSCQWFLDGMACPFWLDEKEYESNKCLFKLPERKIEGTCFYKSPTIKEFEEYYHKKITIKED